MNFIGKQETSRLRRRKQVRMRNPLTLSPAAVTAYEPDASNRNPLTLSSAAVTVYDLAGSNRTSVDDSPFEPRHTRVSLAAEDL